MNSIINIFIVGCVNIGILYVDIINEWCCFFVKNIEQSVVIFSECNEYTRISLQYDCNEYTLLKYLF